MTEGAAARRHAAAHVFVEPDDLDAAGALAMSDDTQHHLSRVLRLRDGESVTVTDGVGRWRSAVVVGARESLTLEPVGGVTIEHRTHDPVTLATAIPKGDRVDWLVQKTTELGVDRIRFLHAERSVVRWKSERVAKQLERLRRISDEAARQSRRVWRVTIDAPLPAADVLPGAVIAEPGGREVTERDSFLAVGPEGGWSPEELQTAADQVRLGQNVLRTETACLAAITLCVLNRH